jgi:hypothetical protein
MRQLLWVPIALSLLAVAVPSSADWIALYDESAYYDPFIHDTGSLITTHVLLDGFNDLTSVSFRLDVPECPGLTLVGESYPSGVYSGNVEDGVTVTFAGCESEPIHVATLTFLSAGVTECCYLDFEPHPDSPGPYLEASDCAANTVNVVAGRSVIAPAGSGVACGAPTVPENPGPADGATGQPLAVSLDWQTSYPMGTGLGIPGNLVYFGTSSDPPQHSLYWEDLEPPYEVGGLAPNTTYYWKIVAYSGDYGTTEGPVWRFTTEDAVATEVSTWGRIKAFYRR